MSVSLRSEEVERLATELNFIARELVNSKEVELDRHDTFYMGYVAGLLAKLAGYLKEKENNDGAA